MSGSSSASSAAKIGGAVGGGVALLLFVVAVVMCVWRKRRRRRVVVNDASVVNDVAQYPISSTVIRSRKGDGVQLEYPIEDTRPGNVLHAQASPDAQGTSTAGTAAAGVVGAQSETSVLDITTASVMFRQLERFMRSLQGGGQQRDLASADDRDFDSLPQYSSVVDV